MIVTYSVRKCGRTNPRRAADGMEMKGPIYMYQHTVSRVNEDRRGVEKTVHLNDKRCKERRSGTAMKWEQV